jgi:hypothetical protein
VTNSGHRFELAHVSRKASLVALAIIALTGILIVAGCGSSSGDGTQGRMSADSTLTKAQFIKRADAICRRTDTVQKEQLAAYEKAHPKLVLAGPPGEKAVKAVLLPPIGTELQQIAALEAPGETQAQLAPIYRGWTAALRVVQRKPVLIMGFGEGPFTQPDRLAAAFGFKDCAKAL